ncbi:MAG: substrate-binding domain-containing protein [Tetrasphaera jenkinsii]|nr:substrate-binding domain-containing protein [Tetrasphaera jenkinsii]
MTPPSIKDVARLAEVSIGTVSKGVPVILVDQASSRGELPWCSVGVDDFAAGTSVPLTTVAQPRHEIGRMALQLLEEEVAAGEEHVHRQVRYTPELVIRASSG